ncbi:kelch repeat-containing protein [Defluviicoccus vanus]
MSRPRILHTATLLPNGKVLVAGGAAEYLSLTATATSELYDPLSGKWSVTGSMKTPRNYHQAVLLPNGKVLVMGGRIFWFPILYQLQKYTTLKVANGQPPGV